MILDNARPMAIHPRDRLIWQPGVFFAGLLPGRSGAANGYGIGDCLLIDAHRGVYAAADASERCTEASRALLERFHAGLPAASGRPSGAALDEAVSKAFAGQAYTARSTFCCAALRWHRHQPVARIYNGGDSFVAIVAGAGDEVIHRSPPDMQFAGRSATAPAGRDVVLNLKEHWLILLATDGWHDLKYPDGGGDNTEEPLAEAVSVGKAPALERIPGADDLAYIIVSPGAALGATRDGPAVIAGGTTPAEAAAACRRRSHRQAPPDWLPHDRWPGCQEAITDAGIRIVSPVTAARFREDLP